MLIRALRAIAPIIIVSSYCNPLIASDSPSPFSGGIEERSERDINDGKEEENYVDSLRPMLIGGVSIGGEHVGELDSINTREDTVKSGGGWFFGGGFRYEFPDENMAFQSNFSIHYNSNDNKDGRSRISRFPLDFLLLYNFKNQSIGGGLTYHLSPEAKIDVKNDTLTRKMEDAMGAIVEYNYRINDNYIVGARITNIEYKTKEGKDVGDVGGEKLDASHFSMTAYYFY